MGSFGSCISLQCSVRFGFWTCNALVLPFRSVRKANIDQCSVLLSCRLACKLRPWYIVQATVRFSIWKPCRSNFKCNVQGFVTFAWKNGFLQHAENCINTSVFAVGAVQKHCKYRGILPLRTDTNFFSSRRPARITSIINNSNDSKHFSLDSFLLFFLRCYCGDAFYSDTFLQTDDVTHKSLYTEQLLCTDTLTQGGLCTEKLYTQTFLRTEAFMQRIF